MEDIELSRETEIIIKEQARNIHYELIDQHLVQDNPSVNSRIRNELVESITDSVKSTIFKFQIK